MLGMTTTRTYFYHLRSRQVRHNSRVVFHVPVGQRVGTISEVCNADSFGDVWVRVEFYEPVIEANTAIWLKSTSVKVIRNAAA